MSDTCPFSASFLFPTEQPRPFDLYRQLRETAPVFWSDQMSCFVVTPYELVVDVIRDTDTFSSLGTQNGIVNASVAGEIEAIRATGYPIVPFLVTNDPPHHGVFRKAVGKLFDARRMRSMQGNVDRLVGDLLGTYFAKGGGDFMSEVATPLPVMVIADLLGIPSSDWRLYRTWGDAYVAPMNGNITPEHEVECARLMRDYQDFFVARIEERRANPRDDLISELVHTPLQDLGRTMDIPELLSAIQQFLVAGGETTTFALGSSMLHLAQHHDLMVALRQDEKKQQTFIEEMLRLQSPSQGIYRLTTRDTALGGVAIPAGSFVNVRLAAANRDESVFAQADAVDVERPNAARHLTFGSGIHTCMGAQLARIEISSALREALSRADFVVDEAAGGFEYFPSTFFMGLEHLYLKTAAR